MAGDGEDRDEGRSVKKLLPPLTFLLCVALMVLLRWFWPIMMFAPFPYNLLGIVPIILGLGTGIAGAITFRKAKTNLRPFTEADKLVTSGPFRFTRNPMYLGLVVALTGVCLLLGSLSSLLAVPIFVVLADRWFIGYEERMLKRKFGPAFEAYRTHVRRWI
jgi:protein-S-isoprenylcysteine O-methyltransferase Ste14